MRKSTFHALAFSILVGLPTASLAGSEDIVIEDAWARASIGTNRPGVAYMTLRNTGTDPVTLVGLETPLAMMPDIHETTTDSNGVSSMGPVGEINISPGECLAGARRHACDADAVASQDDRRRDVSANLKLCRWRDTDC